MTDQKTLAKIEDLVKAEPLGDMTLRGFSLPVTVSNIVQIKR